MPYVSRTNGVVDGVYISAQPGYADEFLPDGHEDILTYQNPIERRINEVIAAYEVERGELTLSHYAAHIAGGENEATRKAAIEAEMLALDAQLDADILAIIMEV